MNPIRRRLVAVAALLAVTASLHAQGAPKVEAAWARPTVPGQAGGGGFFKITGGSAPDRLLAASASVSKAVELHTMTMDGSVMQMRQIQAIDVPAGKTVELKPGGMHVMFVGLTQPLKIGATFPMTLRFEKAGEVKVDVKVLTAPAGAAEHDAHKH